MCLMTSSRKAIIEVRTYNAAELLYDMGWSKVIIRHFGRALLYPPESSSYNPQIELVEMRICKIGASGNKIVLLGVVSKF